MNKYEKTIRQWDEIFASKNTTIPQHKNSGNTEFDKSLFWLIQNADSIIDFGCADGSLLFLCSQYGTVRHIGIDLSSQAIANARQRLADVSGQQSFQFTCGGTEALQDLESSSMDAAILSNILDNLYPEDAHCVLTQMKRILKPKGRLLVKLNPCLSAEQISEYKIKPIGENLYDDGMLLWNNPTDEWDRILEQYFRRNKFKTIYYKELDLYQRLYELERT